MSDLSIDQDQDGNPPGICAHPPCTCESGTLRYCSEACQTGNAAEVDDAVDSSGCACGHDGCGASPAPA